MSNNSRKGSFTTVIIPSDNQHASSSERTMATIPANNSEFFQERAAVREFDGGFDRRTAELLANCDCKCPGDPEPKCADCFQSKSIAHNLKTTITEVDLVERDPRALKIHPYSTSVFGSEMDDHLEDCIRIRGIVEPLIICRSADSDLDERIVSGRRRQMAAISLGLSTVPCLYLECNDLHEFQKRVILYNVRAF